MHTNENTRQQHRSRKVALTALIADRPLDLRRLIADFCVKLGMELDGKGYLAINISPTLHRFFRGDSLVIHDLLNNIVRYCLKIHHDGGVVIHVRSEKLSTRQHKVFFVITVSGQEIPDSNLRMIFHSSAERAAAGAGDGTSNLAIAKMITTTLGGDIVVVNTGGYGTVYNASIKLDPLADPLPLTN